MEQIKKIEVLVHPEWLVEYKPGMEVAGKKVEEHELEESLKQLKEAWRNRIKELKGKTNHVLVLVAKEEKMKPLKRAVEKISLPLSVLKKMTEEETREVGERQIKEIRELSSLAKKELGEKRAVIIGSMPGHKIKEPMKAILNARGFKPSEDTEIEGYGIYAEGCVKNYLHQIGDALGIPESKRTINLERSVHRWISFKKSTA